MRRHGLERALLIGASIGTLLGVLGVLDLAHAPEMVTEDWCARTPWRCVLLYFAAGSGGGVSFAVLQRLAQGDWWQRLLRWSASGLIAGLIVDAADVLRQGSTGSVGLGGLLGVIFCAGCWSVLEYLRSAS